MGKRISTTEAEQLLAGATLAGRPELSDLAATIGRARAVAAATTAPAPTAQLLARLTEGAPSPASTAGDAAVASSSITAAADSTRAVRRPALIEGAKSMAEWIAGLGLASKIALAAGVGLAGMTVAGAAGAAGVLPVPAQSAFDTVISTITGTEPEIDDDPAPFTEDESDVNDDPAPNVEDETDVDDDPAPNPEDESDVNDDPAPYVEDESDVNDDPAPDVEDESDVNDDSAPYVEDESDADDDAATAPDED